MYNSNISNVKNWLYEIKEWNATIRFYNDIIIIASIGHDGDPILELYKLKDTIRLYEKDKEIMDNNGDKLDIFRELEKIEIKLV